MKFSKDYVKNTKFNKNKFVGHAKSKYMENLKLV